MSGTEFEVARMAVVAMALAFLAESLTEYFFAPTKLAPYALYIAPAVGVFLAVNFQVDLFAVFLGLHGLVPYSGPVLSGVMFGRGSNWLHDFLKRLTGAQEDGHV